MELLRVENVTKTIRKKKLVEDLSFTVNSGEIVGFLGPNGSGKTTTIKLITGLMSISKGEITVNGKNVVTNFEAAMEDIGAIIENPEMYGNLSGYDNLKLFSSVYENITEERINEVVRQVKLENRIQDKVKRYSLGMRQRLGIAQAILHKPKLLILDEPTNGLDPMGIKDMRDTLKQLTEEGAGVLISSHMLSEMELMCDRIIVIDNGKYLGSKELHSKTDENRNKYIVNVTDEGKAKEILDKLNIVFEITAEGISVNESAETIIRINKELVINDVGVSGINQVNTTLEEEFINITKGTDNQIR